MVRALFKVANCVRYSLRDREIKKLAPFRIKKEIVECLVRSSLNFNGKVYRQLPNYLNRHLKWMQMLQFLLV